MELSSNYVTLPNMEPHEEAEESQFSPYAELVSVPPDYYSTPESTETITMYQSCITVQPDYHNLYSEPEVSQVYQVVPKDIEAEDQVYQIVQQPKAETGPSSADVYQLLPAASNDSAPVMYQNSKTEQSAETAQPVYQIVQQQQQQEQPKAETVYQLVPNTIVYQQQQQVEQSAEMTQPSSSSSSSAEKKTSNNHFCQICNKPFPTPSKVKRHIMAVHENIKEFKCDLCGHEFSQNIHVVQHRSKTHKAELENNPGLASKKNFRFTTIPLKSYTEAPSPSKSDNGTKKCTVGETLLKLEPVEPPASAVKQAGPGPNSVSPSSAKVCPTCNKSLSTNWQLKKHIQAVHEKLRPFKCDSCERTFSAKKNLVIHVNRAHQKRANNNTIQSCSSKKKEFEVSKVIFKCMNCVFDSEDSSDMIEHHLKNHAEVAKNSE